MKIDEGRCVYALYNPITKLTKIGVTDNIESRKTSLENGCGCRLELIHITKHLLCGETYEADVHARLAKYRTLGEWFNTPSHNISIDAINTSIESATEDAIVENYKKGMPISKIASEYEVTRQAILARLKKYGVYDNKGQIHERYPRSVKEPIPPKAKNKTVEHISNIDESLDDTIYLDGIIPPLPLHNVKRVAPNLNFNGEWYQVSIFKDGEFIYAYSKDIVKAQAYIQGVRAVDFANTTKQ